MLNKKEKEVKKYLLDESIDFSNEDKEDILNKIKSKIDLEVEEKPSFRQRFNLKVVYAMVCSLVICVLGYFGIKALAGGYLVGPNYKGKDVESLNLNDGDYCLAYNAELKLEQYNYLKNEYDLNFIYEKRMNAYLISKDESLIFVFGGYEDKCCNISLKKSPSEIINIYNSTYNASFNKTNLNNNNSGFLFLIWENGIEFYTKENNKKLAIFIEFA